MASPSQNQILVIRGGAIGDFVLTLPVFAALRRQFPQTRLEVLGYPHIAGLALAGGLVETVQPIESRAMAGFFARGIPPAPELAAYFARFAIIISYLYDPDRIFTDSVAACSGAQFIQGPHRPDEKGSVHASELFLKPLERLAIFDADPAPRLNLPRPGAAGPFTLAVHPGSGSERKNWPERKWAELLARLAAESSFRFLLVGGEAEGEKLQRLAAALPAARVEIARNLALPELAARLAQCSGFMGHDSGITHLAAAVGLTGVVLWADTPQAVWRPRSDKMHLLREPAGIHVLSVDTVAQAARKVFNT